MSKYKFNCPKEFEDESARVEFGNKLRQDIDSYMSTMSKRFESWKEVQDTYDGLNKPSSISFGKDIKPYHIPIMKPRVDAVAASMADGILSVSPYFVVNGLGTSAQRMEEIEQTIDFALKQAEFEFRVKDASRMSCLLSRGVIRCRYTTVTDSLYSDESDTVALAIGDKELDTSESGETQKPAKGKARYSGLVMESIRPDDFIAFPTYCEKLTECSIVGHRMYQRLEDIELKIAQGRYFPVVVPDTYDTKSPSASSDTPGVQTDRKDFPGLTWDLIVRYRPPGFDYEKRYRVSMLFNYNLILCIEEYKLPMVNYFAPTIKREVTRFWPSQSLGEMLMEPQALFNDAWTLIAVGGLASAYTSAIVTGWAGDEKTIQLGIGEIVCMPQAVGVTPISAQVNLNGAKMALEEIPQLSDAITRYSPAGLGQQFAGNTTATEVDQVVAGQRTGISEFAEEFGSELERLADFVRFLLYDNWKAFKEFWGDAVPIEDPEVLQEKIQVLLNGKTATSSPQVQIQKLMALAGALKQYGVQMLPPSKVYSADGMIEAMLNALDLNVNLAKIYYDPNQEQPKEVTDLNPDEQELIAAIRARDGQLQGNVPPQGMGGGASPMLPSNGNAVSPDASGFNQPSAGQGVTLAPTAQ